MYASAWDVQLREFKQLPLFQRDNITTSASQCGRIIRELSTSRIRPIVDALLAEAEQCSSAARALENDVVQYVSQRSDEGRGEDTLVASVDFSTRCNALPTLSHAVAQSRLLGTWTEAITSYLATAKGPSVRPTLQAEGFELLEDASKTVTASLDDTAAARQRTSNAIEALSRAVARDAIAHQQRTAADLLEARSTAAALTGQLAQATSSLAALSTEIAAVQVGFMVSHVSYNNHRGLRCSSPLTLLLLSVCSKSAWHSARHSMNLGPRCQI